MIIVTKRKRRGREQKEEMVHRLRMLRSFPEKTVSELDPMDKQISPLPHPREAGEERHSMLDRQVT